MPPSRRSGSSHSSRSHSRSRSRSHSHSSHGSSVVYARHRSNQPRAPKNIVSSSLTVRCRNHDYVYYKSDWTDEKTGQLYKRGYYDEYGKYYDAEQLVFKKPDGSYVAHYHCAYCDSDLEQTWQEGFYPTCKNCGAEK